MNRQWLIRIMVLTLIGGALWVTTMLIAYTDRGYICENTGSRKGCREWFFGVKTNEWYAESELERFLKSTHPEVLRHRWTSYRGTGRSLIPFAESRGHGSPGPLLSPSSEMLDAYVRSLSSEQRLELYHIFSSAKEDRIQDRVNRIIKFGSDA